MKRLSIETRLLTAFAAGLGVLALCAWWALQGATAYLDASREAERLALAAHTVADLRASLLDARVAAVAGPATPAPVATGADAGMRRALGDLALVLEQEPDLAQRIAGVTQSSPGLLDADLAALDARIMSRGRDASAAARQHAARTRSVAWLLATLVIMALSVAYAFVMGGVRERRRLLSRLRQSANHDPLTGLPNRRFFGEWLGFAIAHARREVRHVGLLFIEIEGVKAVAELHGQADADELLVEVARRFRETAREGDVLARTGANEFALAIPDVTDPREAAPLAQRLRDALADPARPPLADTPIGASVGVAFYPDDATDPAGVMAAADAAMYEAKGAGRNRVAFKPLAQAA